MLESRINLYRRLEEARGRPLITYVTSTRGNAQASIAADVVPELMAQLNALPAGTSELDLLIVSNGGDPTVAWRIVSLIRERVKSFAVLIPQSAYSAATLIALGADEIVIHPNGNLGPTDPQIRAPKRGKDADTQLYGFGSEDLSAFLKFARDEVGLTDQTQMLSVFNHFCEEVGSVAVGVAARSAQLLVRMGEKLLQLHMNGETNKAKARTISQALTSNYFHHGYAVSRSEAKDSIELPVADSNTEVEQLMWDIWLDISEEMQLREPFNPVTKLRAEPSCAPLFSPPPVVQIPGNLPAPAQQQAINQALAQMSVIPVPAVPFELLYCVMESSRLASRNVSGGLIFAAQQPDLNLRMSLVFDRQGWVDAETAASGQLAPAATKRPKTAAKRRGSATRKAARRSSQVNVRKGKVRTRG